MALDPVHFDFVESPYHPSLLSRRGAKAGPFPLVGLTAAQFDGLAAWDLQLDADRSDDRKSDDRKSDDVAEPMTDRPRPQGDPLEREVNREVDREGASPNRGDRVRKADDLPVDERP